MMILDYEFYMVLSYNHIDGVVIILQSFISPIVWVSSFQYLRYRPLTFSTFLYSRWLPLPFIRILVQVFCDYS